MNGEGGGGRNNNGGEEVVERVESYSGCYSGSNFPRSWCGSHPLAWIADNRMILASNRGRGTGTGTGIDSSRRCGMQLLAA